MNKRLILASLCSSVALAIAPAAHAQWGGYYFDDEDNFEGLSVGGQVGWERTSLTLTDTATTDTATPVTMSASGFNYGFYGGYDIQLGSGVFGVEALINPNTKAGGSVTNARTLVDSMDMALENDDGEERTVEDSVSFDGRFRLDISARAGYVLSPQLLVYARGGYGWQRMRISYTPGTESPALTPAPAAVSASTLNRTARGFVAGGGIEYVLFPGLNLRADYRYSDLNFNITDDEAEDINTPFERFDGNSHMITAGISLRF